MKVQKFGQSLLWVLLVLSASACDMEGICKLGEEGSCQSTPHAVCYGGENPKKGDKGICMYGELSPEGKPVAKITAWRLLLSNRTEVEPVLWDKRDKEAEADRENAEAGWVGMAEATVEVEVAGLGPDKGLRVWASHGAEARCTPPAGRRPQGELWTCTFSGGWASVSPEAESIEVRAQAEEAEARIRKYRTLCRHNLVDLASHAVTQPLAMSGKRLLFGTAAGDTQGETVANNSLYVFDTEACALVGSLHTGAVQGPMVALGDTGRVAIAINNHGPVDREVPRLSVAEISGAAPGFAHSNDRDCQSTPFVFAQGLSLHRFADAEAGTSWRLVAPAAGSSACLLVAYAPDATSNICSPRTARCFRAPMSQDSNKAVVGIYRMNNNYYIQGQVFDEENETWNSGPGERVTPNIQNVSPLAVVDMNFWVRDLSFESPVAVDGEGWVYFAAKPSDSDDYHLQRKVPLSQNEGRIVRSSAPFSGVPVGSPLLGEPPPGGEAEVYVVTTTGRVLAYGLELGEPLWTYNLGVHIWPTAQPVLSGDTLWVVGARGEVRGIRLSSRGLSRTAQWPKAFRDNCNSSSRLSTPATLPSCF